MTENSAIFNARHGGGSFHPHRQPAPTAQDCLKRGTGANGERPGSYLVNVGLIDAPSSAQLVDCQIRLNELLGFPSRIKRDDGLILSAK